MWVENVSRRIDQKPSSSMRGLREASIVSVVGPVMAIRSVQAGSWGGAAFYLACGVVGIAWAVLWWVRVSREQRVAHPSPPPPPRPEPFTDNPHLRARVDAGRSELDHLVSQLKIIKKRSGGAGGSGQGAHDTSPK